MKGKKEMENAKMSWEEFEAAGGTWEEFVDDVMHDLMGELWDEINKEEAK